MTPDLQALAAEIRKAAERATPGPWSVVIRGERGTFHISETKAHEASVMDTDGCDGCSVSHANRRYIALANPANILPILDALAAAEEEIRQDQEALADLRDALTAAEARIAELEAGGWQDIETAPKDGRSILIYEREYNLMDRAYYVAGSGWHNGTHKFRYASHWRPLPEAPK